VPKVSQEHLDARRAQILDGARRAFARYGYEGATVARLEEETGLSRGAIFHYYRDKKELFVALAAEVNRHYIELMQARGISEAIRAIANESPEWIGAFLEAEVRLHHDEDFVRRLTEATEHLHSPMLDWFREQQRAGVLRSDLEPLELGRFATIVINGLALRVAGGDETNPESVVRLLEDALAPRK
jgi:TetR/AcrR family transcriptional regulator, transcriptional repressor of aconitase